MKLSLRLGFMGWRWRVIRRTVRLIEMAWYPIRREKDDLTSYQGAKASIMGGRPSYGRRGRAGSEPAG